MKFIIIYELLMDRAATLSNDEKNLGSCGEHKTF